MLCESTEIEEYQRDAGGAILDRLRTIRQLVDRLDKWREHDTVARAVRCRQPAEEIAAEIREEHPNADEREIKLRVAIRESVGMTREEEDTAYDKISKALQ